MKRKILDIIIYITGVLGGAAAFLFGVDQTDFFTNNQSLNFLTHRSLLYFIMFFGFGASAILVYIIKHFLPQEPPPFNYVQGPSGTITEATLVGFKKEIKEVTDELAEEAESYFEAGERDYTASRFRDAAQNFQKSLDILPTMSGYLNLGNSYYSVSDIKNAETACVSGLQISRRKKDRMLESAFLGSMGLICFDKGDLAEALKYQRQALDIHKEIGYRQGEASDLGNMGLVYSAKGNLDEALKYLQGARDIYLEIGIKGEGPRLVEKAIKELTK